MTEEFSSDYPSISPSYAAKDAESLRLWERSETNKMSREELRAMRQEMKRKDEAVREYYERLEKIQNDVYQEMEALFAAENINPETLTKAQFDAVINRVSEKLSQGTLKKELLQMDMGGASLAFREWTVDTGEDFGAWLKKEFTTEAGLQRQVGPVWVGALLTAGMAIYGPESFFAGNRWKTIMKTMALGYFASQPWLLKGIGSGTKWVTGKVVEIVDGALEFGGAEYQKKKGKERAQELIGSYPEMQHAMRRDVATTFEKISNQDKAAKTAEEWKQVCARIEEIENIPDEEKFKQSADPSPGRGDGRGDDENIYLGELSELKDKRDYYISHKEAEAMGRYVYETRLQYATPEEKNEMLQHIQQGHHYPGDYNKTVITASCDGLISFFMRDDRLSESFMNGLMKAQDEGVKGLPDNETGHKVALSGAQEEIISNLHDRDYHGIEKVLNKGVFGMYIGVVVFTNILAGVLKLGSQGFQAYFGRTPRAERLATHRSLNLKFLKEGEVKIEKTTIKKPDKLIKALQKRKKYQVSDAEKKQLYESFHEMIQQPKYKDKLKYRHFATRGVDNEVEYNKFVELVGWKNEEIA